jgi:hypothetical protein
MRLIYHASTKTNLTIIEPIRTLYDDNKKSLGKYVFATYNEKYAAMYLVKLGYYSLMSPHGKKPHIIIQSNVKDFIAKDQGGTIYTLNDKTFDKTPQAGLERTERVSKVSVEPIDKRVYKSSIEAMSDMGIKIYFVNAKMFKKFLEIKNDNDKKLLPLLEPFSPTNIK